STDLQAFRSYVDAFGGKIIQFLNKNKRVDHHPVTDDVHGVFPENAAGNQVKYVFFILHLNAMTGVVSALVTGDDIGFLTEKIDNLSFPLISPLTAYGHNY